MNVFHVFALKNTQKIKLKRIIVNFLHTIPLFFTLLTNASYMIKYRDQLDIAGLTDHIYTFAIFIMFISIYIIFSINQIHFSDFLFEINSFIEKRKID